MGNFVNKLTVGELRMFSGRLVSKAGESLTISDEDLTSPEVEQALERGWIEKEAEAKEPVEVKKPVEASKPVKVEVETSVETPAAVVEEVEVKEVKTRQKKAN